MHRKYSMRGHVDINTAQESAVFISKHAPKCCIFVHLNSSGVLSGITILYFELVTTSELYHSLAMDSSNVQWILRMMCNVNEGGNGTYP